MSPLLPTPRPLAHLALAVFVLGPLPALARQTSATDQTVQPGTQTAPSQIQTAQPGAQTAQPATQPAPDAGRQTTPQPGILPPSASPLQPLPAAGSGSFSVISPITAPTVSPGALTLLELDGRLSQAVAAGGGKSFAEWFAPDAVTLNNGKPAIQGRTSIAASATWAPADYQLSWIPQGASMGPSNDMGYTWGSYQGRARDRNGQTITTTGRYITVWRKQHDDSWKIALEASADDAPAAGSCCKLPTTP